MGICGKCIKAYGDYWYFIFRVLVGFMFFLHGASKFGLYGEGSIAGFAGAFGFPVWLASLAALVELVGGLFIAMGFLTRLAATGGAIQMIVAYIIAHAPQGLNPLSNQGELPLLYLAAFLVLMIHGAGRWRLETLFWKTEIF